MISGLLVKIILGVVGVGALLGTVAWFISDQREVGRQEVIREQLEQALRKSEEGRRLRAEPLNDDERTRLLLPREPTRND